MTKVALLTIHGMGETERDYADALLEKLRHRLHPADADLSTHVVYYQGSLQPNEREVWDRMDRGAKVHYDALRKFILFGFADAAGLENQKEDDDSVYVDAQVEIARHLLAARDRVGPTGPVVVIAQSLGGQVFSSYLYDAQKKAAGREPVGIWKDIDRFAPRICDRPGFTPGEKDFLAGHTVRRFVTTGCNIPVFVAAHKSMSIRAIQPPCTTGDFRWLNLFDPDDVLGWPLQPLSPDYRELVEDRSINAGQGFLDFVLKSWNPDSHTAYWTDDNVLRPLEAMIRELS